MRFYISPLLVIVLLYLALTNPTSERYSAWVKQEIAGSPQTDPLVRLMAYAFGDPLVQISTQRKDLLFFSLFSTTLDEEHRFITLGIAGNFVQLPAVAVPKPWQAGVQAQNFPHVLTAEAPNTWRPEDGYVWVRQPPEGDLRVRWQPGLASRNFQHIVAADPEGKWLPEDGYFWNENPPPKGRLGVHWAPGKQSVKHEHVVAALQEGRWLPQQGFEWVENPPPPGDFRTKRIEDDEAAALPRLRGVPLQRCTKEDHFGPDVPCWFSGENGIYVASKLGNMRSSTFARWPDVDEELSGLDELRSHAMQTETAGLKSQGECDTVFSRPVESRDGVTLFEGLAVCTAAACSPNERVGAHWRCPDRGGTPTGRWEYAFGPRGTRWRQIGEANWHPLSGPAPSRRP